MMHHNTKFGNKMFGNLEDIIRANTGILTLCCYLYLECSNPIFFHKTLWLMMMYHQTKLGSQGINSSENIVESYFDMNPHCDLDLKDSNKTNFCMTFWLMMLHHHTKYGNKMFCNSEDTIWTNIL